MNLRQARGKVPIEAEGETPWLLIDWPTREQFNAMYSRKVTAANLQRYWEILTARSQGSTLQAAGAPHQVTRERVRQIEAKFQRLMRQWHFSKTAKPQKSHAQASSR